MKFISFQAMANETLDKKVNEFLKNRTEDEILDMKYTSNLGSLYVAILYNEKKVNENLVVVKNDDKKEVKV